LAAVYRVSAGASSLSIPAADVTKRAP